MTDRQLDPKALLLVQNSAPFAPGGFFHRSDFLLPRTAKQFTLDTDQRVAGSAEFTLRPMARYDWVQILGIATLIATVGAIFVVLLTL